MLHSHFLAITLPFPNPFNVFNPFDWVAGQLKDLLNQLVTMIQQLIVNPPQPASGPWQSYIYGNALGLAEVLVIPITIITVLVAFFYQKRLHSLFEAVTVAAIIGTAGPSWFFLCDYLVGIGDQLSKAVMFSNAPGGSSSGLLSFPSISNIVGSIAASGSVLFGGSWLVMLFMVYQLAIIFVKFIGLPALLLYPLGQRAKKFVHALISIALVTMVFGRPAANLALELGKFAANNVSGGLAPWGQLFFVDASLFFAFALQPLLFFVAFKSTNFVTGQVNSVVRGKVEALNKQHKSRTPQDINAAHVKTMAPVATSAPAPKTGGVRQVKDVAVREGMRLGAMALTGGNPAAGTVATAAHSAHTTRRDARRRSATKKG